MLTHVRYSYIYFICILIFVYMAQLPMMYSSCENIHTRCVYVFTRRMPSCILCVKTYTECICFYTSNAYLHSLCKSIHTMCMLLHKECLPTSLMLSSCENIHTNMCVCFRTKKASILQASMQFRTKTYTQPMCVCFRTQIASTAH